MTYVLYDTITSLAAPAAAAWLALQRKHRPLLARFNPPIPAVGDSPVWIQACSVGEVAGAAPLIRGLQERWPQLPVLLSTSTVTGHDRAVTLLPEIPTAWFPFDHRAIVNRMFRRLNPRMLVLVETEIWPNVLRAAHRFGVPAVLVNARVSDRHFPCYMRYRRLLGPAFSRIRAAGAWNQTYADRLAALGMKPENIRVTGNTKFDGLTTRVDPQTQDRLRMETGLREDSLVILFGSTRPGDEATAAGCWRELRGAYPAARLIIAPRHVQRVPEILPLFDEPVRLRSQTQREGGPVDARILILDTLGELVSFYSLAHVAIIGGSFHPGVNGHNPLEPAALGIPTVFGPYMSNFADPARMLVENRAAVQLPGPETLAATITGLLDNPPLCLDMTARARQAIAANQGAIGRTLDLLSEVMLNCAR